MGLNIILTMLPFANHVYTPPLSLPYLKAYLEQDSDISVTIVETESIFFRSKIIKSNVSEYWDRISWGSETRHISPDAMLLLDDIVERLLQPHPDVVGFSVTNSNQLYTEYVSRCIKEKSPHIYLVYGGRRFCSRKNWRWQVKQIHERECSYIDCIVKNEGEETFKEIIKTIKTGRKPVYCAGTTLNVNGEIIDCGDRAPILDLDSIPFPDYSDYDKKNLLANYIRIKFNRGCPGVCDYCSENDEMGEGVRVRSPENIIAEIKLRMTQGYTRFQISDLCANANTKQLEQICTLIIAEKLDIEFIFAMFRHSPLMTKNTFQLLRAAGFKLITFGTESGSQQILNKMRKGVRVETIDKNLREAYDAGLNVMLYLMIGYPGETEETFQETIDLLSRNEKYIYGVGHTAEVIICGNSGIIENLKAYALDESTICNVFAPEIWKTVDGRNTHEWRMQLIKRINTFMSNKGIRMITYTAEGTPVYQNTVSLKIAHVKQSLFHQITKKTQKKVYAAQVCDLHFLEQKGKAYVKIKNTGTEKWDNTYDAICAGCKIYLNNKLVTELRSELPKVIFPGETFTAEYTIDIPLEKGVYLLKFDMVNEKKFWFEDCGSEPLVEELIVESF